MSRRAAKTDANQRDIVRALRQVGFHVAPTHTVGSGFPDLVVTGYSVELDAVVSCLVEVKTERGMLTDDEAVWHAEFPQGGPLIVARSAEDVLRWFGRG